MNNMDRYHIYIYIFINNILYNTLYIVCGWIRLENMDRFTHTRSWPKWRRWWRRNSKKLLGEFTPSKCCIMLYMRRVKILSYIVICMYVYIYICMLWMEKARFESLNIPLNMFCIRSGGYVGCMNQVSLIFCRDEFFFFCGHWHLSVFDLEQSWFYRWLEVGMCRVGCGCILKNAFYVIMCIYIYVICVYIT